MNLFGTVVRVTLSYGATIWMGRLTLIVAPHTANWRYELSPVLSSRVTVPIVQLAAAVAETVILERLIIPFSKCITTAFQINTALV
jgi:hypothetical protein